MPQLTAPTEQHRMPSLDDFITRGLAMADGQILIRTHQVCPKCDGAFHESRQGLSCPSCMTIPSLYYIRWRFQGQSFKKTGFHSFFEAFESAQEIKQLIKTHTFRVENFTWGRKNIQRKHQIETVVAEYISRREKMVSLDGLDESGLAPYTYKSQRLHLLEFAAWCKSVSVLDIRTVKTYEIISFRDFLKEKKNSTKTVYNKLGTLRKMFNDLVDLYGNELVPDMPKIELPNYTPKDPVTMPLEDRAKALDCVPAEHQPFFRFMERCPLRPAEIEAMRWSHLELEAKVPYWLVQAECVDRIERQITKTKNRWGYPLNEEEIKIIKSQPRSFQTDRVFYFNHGKSHIPYFSNKCCDIWRLACTAAGVEYVAPYNAFRHTTITDWIDSGMNENDASDLVGHRDKRTIKKYNAGLRVAVLAKAKEKIK